MTQPSIKDLKSRLADWNKKGEDFDSHNTYVFGSLIYKGGAQFNEHSDIDLVVRIPPGTDAPTRVRWLSGFLSHKDALEIELLKAQRGDATESRVSVVAVTDIELKGNIHKDGHQEFFSANSFYDLLQNKVFVVRQFETDQAFREERFWLIRVRV